MTEKRVKHAAELVCGTRKTVITTFNQGQETYDMIARNSLTNAEKKTEKHQN